MPTQIKTVFPALLFVLGLIGFADATYLTVKKLSGQILPCVVTSNCEIVTNSQYANIGPIPVSLFGAGYYLLVIILSIVVLETKSSIWLARLSIFTWVGFLFSLYLVTIMAFVLKAYCFWCLVSAGTSTLLFIVGMIARSWIRNTGIHQEIPPTVSADRV